MPINPKIGPGRYKKRDKKAHVTGTREIVRAQRAADILQMRLKGYSLRAIGLEQTPTINESRVYQIIKAELEKAIDEPIEEVRKIELARLDELQKGVYDRATNGDMMAITRVLAIQERRAALAGLNAPTKVEASGPDGGPIVITDEDRAAALIAFLAKVKPAEAK